MGVGVSTLAVIITGALLRHELRARREDKDDADAAQARLVAAGLRNPGIADDGTVEHVYLGVRNYSSGPIYELYVQIRDSRGSQLFAGDSRGNHPSIFAGNSHKSRGQRMALAEEALRRGQKSTYYKRHLGPGAMLDDEVAMYVFTTPVPSADMLRFAEVVIHFIDAAGYAWSKTGTGPPVRIRAFREPKPRHPFWLALWQYLWPISTPVMRISRLRRLTRLRARDAVDAMTRYMQVRTVLRYDKRFRERPGTEEAIAPRAETADRPGGGRRRPGY